MVFRNDLQNKKVEVYLDGRFFTSYLYADDLEKQVLYPILSASGKEITRGFPLDPRPFERADHPHHLGLWFNFGDVNGLDFWNNSYAIKPDEKHRYGTIKFNKFVSQDAQKGKLVTLANWVDHNGNILLEEETSYIFQGNKDQKAIGRITKLTAVQPVTFNENKEGLLGIRMDRAFEEPANNPGKFLDANGAVSETPILNNEGVNGVYRNAEGVIGGEVWGKRSPWVALRAEKEGEIITIVVIDHPQNPNYPAWSHARGYGLFATNNLGGRAFDKDANPVQVKLNPGESILFKHQVIIGGDLSPEEIAKLADNFE
ncbi:MAG: PmoA family protein [Mangrovibacterium sp.]